MLTITLTFAPTSSQSREDFIEDIKLVAEDYGADMDIDSED